MERASSELGRQKAAERRVGFAVLAAAIVAAVVALGLSIRDEIQGRGGQPLPFVLFLGAMAGFGYGLDRVLWAPRADPSGIVPPRVRPWAAVALTLFAWWALAAVAGLVAGAVRR